MDIETAVDKLDDIYLGLEREYSDCDALRKILTGIKFVQSALKNFEAGTDPSEDDLAWSADYTQRVRDAVAYVKNYK